jgi:hypothetical protein
MDTAWPGPLGSMCRLSPPDSRCIDARSGSATRRSAVGAGPASPPDERRLTGLQSHSDNSDNTSRTWEVVPGNCSSNETICTRCVVKDDGEMHRDHRSLRLVSLALVVTLPLLGLSDVASAKVRAKGCHKTHTCRSGGGSPTGSGTGASSVPITIQIDPNPLVETYQSDIAAVVQVETSPSFANDAVNISSSQLTATCSFTDYDTNEGQAGNSNITVFLDDDGNVNLFVEGFNCAPGSDVFEADLEVAPYYTAVGTLVVSPPVVTTPGVYAYPTTSGTVTTGEVATGTGTGFGESDIYAIFYVETSPVYAEQPVEISANELESRCGGPSWALQPEARLPGGVEEPGGTVGPPATSVLDDDGNAEFAFFGASCAAGTSTVVADVEAGTHPTFTTTFTVVAPQPTI